MLENRGTQVKDIGSMRKDMKTDLNFRQRSTCYLKLVIKLLERHATVVILFVKNSSSPVISQKTIKFTVVLMKVSKTNDLG